MLILSSDSASVASGYVKEPGGAFRNAPFIDLSNGGGGINGFVSYFICYPESQVTVAVLSNLPSGGASDERAIIVLADWLGTLAHGGTVTLPAR